MKSISELSFDMRVDGLEPSRPESVLPRELFHHLINISNDMLLKHRGISPEDHATAIIEAFRESMAARVTQKGKVLSLSQRLMLNQRWLHCVSAWANGCLVAALWQRGVVWLNPQLFEADRAEDVKGDHLIADAKHPLFRLLMAIKAEVARATGTPPGALQREAHRLAMESIVDAITTEPGGLRVQFKPARWPACTQQGELD